MTLAWRLLRGYSANPFSTTRYALINGQSGGFNYRIGLATSIDNGATWSQYAGNPIIGTGSGWESTYVKDASLIWDGSQFVCYYAGWNGSQFQIGRATSPDRLTWTKQGSNPVVALGAGGDPDAGGCEFPVVTHNVGSGPAWKVWYMGYPAGATPGSPTGSTVCFADSTDGISWTKRGSVIPVGAGGTFDASATLSGCVFFDGSTWYVYYCGYTTVTNFMHSAYATATDPANPATYTKHGQIVGYTGTFTIAGRTWRSNLPRGIMPEGAGYRVYLSIWNPSDATPYEMAATVTASDLVTWGTPTTQMFPIPGSGWDSESAENPSVIVAP